MPDDDVTAPDAQQPTAGATIESAAPTEPEAPRPEPDYRTVFNFDDVFGRSSGESSGAQTVASTPNQPPPATSAPAAQAATAATGADAASPVTTETPADSTASGEAVADDTLSETPADRKPSRTERIHLDYQEQLAAKDRELAEIRQKLDEASGTLSAEAQRERALQQQFADAYGPDTEYERLTILNNKGLALSAEEYDSLQRWTTTRELARPFQARADARAQQAVERAQESVRQAGLQFADYLRGQLQERAERYGLDPETVQRAEYGGLIDHAVAVAGQRKDAEYAPKLTALEEKVSQLEAQLRESQDIVASTRLELPRGGLPSEAVVNPARVFSTRNIQTPLADDWAAAFDPNHQGRVGSR